MDMTTKLGAAGLVMMLLAGSLLGCGASGGSGGAAVGVGTAR